MPYVYDPNLEDEDKDPSQVQISGAAPTADAEGAPDKQNTSSTPNTGSGFQNLDKYLQTNETKGFGEQVTGKVQNEITGAKQSQDQASESFKNKVQSANEVPTSDQVNQAIANPTGVDKQQFQTWENQTYQGPKSLAESQGDYNQYWSGVNKANAQAKLLGSEAGRFSLLDSYFGRPTYNFGQKSLDNLLIQQAPGLGEKTKDLQDQAAQLKTQGTTQAGTLQGLASQRAGEVEQSRKDVRAAIGLDDQGNVLTGDNAGAIGKQYAQVQADLDAQNAARQKQVDDLKTKLASGRLTAEEASALGLNMNENIYNLDLSNYLTPSLELNKNQTMTPEQRAYIRALSDLAGVTDTFASGDAQEVTDPYSYNADKMRSDAAGVKGQYQQALQNTPVTIPRQWTLRGEGQPVPLGQLIQRSNEAQNRIANGDPINGDKEFVRDVVPIILQAQKDIASKYQTSRTLALPDEIRMGGGPGSTFNRYRG